MSELGGSPKDWEELDFPPPLWIIRDNFAVGDAGFIHGDQETFKSYFMLQFCIQIAAGVPLFSGVWPAPDKPLTTLYLQSEGSPYMWRERLLESVAVNAAGNKDIPFFSYHVQNLKLDSKKGKAYVCERIEEHEPSLLVLDPISNLFTGSDSKDTVVEAWRDLWNEWRWKYNIAILGVHHNKKPEKIYVRGKRLPIDPDIDSNRGSTIMPAWADIALGFHRAKGKTDIVTVTMNKLRNSGDRGTEYKFRFMKPSLIPEGKGDAITRAVAAAVFGGPQKQTDVIKRVQEELSSGYSTVLTRIQKAITKGTILSEPSETGKSPILSRGSMR